MNCLRFLACLVLATGLFSSGSPSFAEEPFLRFLDDFHCSDCPNLERDPYEERIETERHDFTQSTITVGRGSVASKSSNTAMKFGNTKDTRINTATLPTIIRNSG